jgi:hypothetical protein
MIVICETPDTGTKVVGETVSCEKCKCLQGFLDRERKELVRLREHASRVSDRAKDRKVLLDKVVSGQTDAAEAVRAASSAIITYLRRYAPGGMRKWVDDHMTTIHSQGFAVLLKAREDEKVFKGRPRDEHAMPWHGKTSS